MTETSILVMAQTLYGEARGEPLEGQIAIAHVIMNRYRSGQWFAGDSITETCLKPMQFSCWNDDAGNASNRTSMMEASLSDRLFLNCLHVALGALLGRSEDPTGGATHYCTSDVHPKWAEGKIPTNTIGRHLFYNSIS